MRTCSTVSRKSRRILIIQCDVLSPPQRPPTVALGRTARRLGRGKNYSFTGVY